MSANAASSSASGGGVVGAGADWRSVAVVVPAQQALAVAPCLRVCPQPVERRLVVHEDGEQHSVRHPFGHRVVVVGRTLHAQPGAGADDVARLVRVPRRPARQRRCSSSGSRNSATTGAAGTGSCWRHPTARAASAVRTSPRSRSRRRPPRPWCCRFHPVAGLIRVVGEAQPAAAATSSSVAGKGSESFAWGGPPKKNWNSENLYCRRARRRPSTALTSRQIRTTFGDTGKPRAFAARSGGGLGSCAGVVHCGRAWRLSSRWSGRGVRAGARAGGRNVVAPVPGARRRQRLRHRTRGEFSVGRR